MSYFKNITKTKEQTRYESRVLPKHIFVPCMLCLSLLLLSQTTYSQVAVFSESFSDIDVQYGGTDSTGDNYPFEVDIEGVNNDFQWGFGLYGGYGTLGLAPSGGAFEYTLLSDGTSFESNTLLGEQALGTWKLNLSEYEPGKSFRIANTEMAIVAQRTATEELPMSGTDLPVFAQADEAVLEMMRENGYEAVTYAVMKDRRLVHVRGFGFQDRARTQTIDPYAVGRWASNTKPVVATMIKTLASEGRLSLDDRLYDLLPTEVAPGFSVSDDRHYDITIRQLLDHRAGVAVNAGDPGYVGYLIGINRGATAAETMSYMLSVPLEHSPGDGFLYSNWGYQILGVVIEEISGLSFESYLKQAISGPIGADTLAVGRSRLEEAAPNEMWYASQFFRSPTWIYPPISPGVALPYAINMELAPGAGALIASAPDFLKYLKHYFQDGNPKPSSLEGISWEFTFYGSIPGAESITRDRIRPDGSSLNYALLINERRYGINVIGPLTTALDSIFSNIPESEWPSHDLWEEGSSTIELGSGNWTVVFGAEPSDLIVDDSTATSGPSSLLVDAPGYVQIVSPAFLPPDLDATGSSLFVDVLVPVAQANPFWLGTTDVFLDFPAGNVFNAYLGQAALTPLETGVWSTLRFNIPDFVQESLRQNAGQIQVKLVSNTDYSSPAGLHFDNLRIGSVRP